MSGQSLADKAVAALSAVAIIGERTTNDHPERHTIRSIRRNAHDILENAFRQAIDLAMVAEQLHNDMRAIEAAKEAK